MIRPTYPNLSSAYFSVSYNFHKIIQSDEQQENKENNSKPICPGCNALIDIYYQSKAAKNDRKNVNSKANNAINWFHTIPFFN